MKIIHKNTLVNHKGKAVYIDEIFKTPKEFDDLLQSLRPLDEKKYIKLAREALRIAKNGTEYRKGIMYFMLSVAHDNELKDNPFSDEISDIGTEFASFDHLPTDEITDQDIKYLEDFVSEIEGKIGT